MKFSVPIHSNPDVDLESQATSFDHYVPPCRLSDSGNGANGFMLISDENEVDLLSQQFKVSFKFIASHCLFVLTNLSIYIFIFSGPGSSI